MSIFISKETITRLLKDVKQILKNPLIENGIYYVHDDVDMMKGYALIIGQPDTPYFGGNYFFELNYPSDYPHSPPKVNYCTNSNNIRFNPNLYVSGKVCISLLNTWRGDQWTSCQTISSLLLSLCTLFCSDPLLNEPGVDKNKNHIDITNYTEIINYSNISIAICDIIEKKEGVFLPFFENFYPFVKENLIQNYYKILQISNKKNNEFKNRPVNFKTEFYSMNITVDYSKLIKRLESYKQKFQIM